MGRRCGWLPVNAVALAGWLAGATEAVAEPSDAGPTEGGVAPAQESALRPPARRPWVEGAVSGSFALPERDAGLSRGRALTVAWLARVVPHVGIGGYYDYRTFAWQARGVRGPAGEPAYFSPDERAWANTWGLLLRGYPLSTGRGEPYLELGLGSHDSKGTVRGGECQRNATPWLVRSGLGFDAYLTPWARAGAVASVSGLSFGGSQSCSLVLRPNAPPGPPTASVGTELGLALTFGGPTRRWRDLGRSPRER